MPDDCAAKVAMLCRAWRTDDLPEPFGPRSRVNGASGRVVFRNALKFVNSIDSIIGRSSVDGAAGELLLHDSTGENSHSTATAPSA